MKEDQYLIQTLADGIDVLLYLAQPKFRSLPVGEIAAGLKLDRGKVFRILHTLGVKGMVRKREERWEIAPEIVKIADGFRRHVASVKAELEDLTRQYLDQ